VGIIRSSPVSVNAFNEIISFHLLACRFAPCDNNTFI
jgi:hypothetical protein